MDDIITRLTILEHVTHQRTTRLRWQRNVALLLLGLGIIAWSLPGQQPHAQEAAAQARAATLEQRVAALEKKLKYLTVTVDKAGYPWMRIIGANVNIINGMGTTDTMNGTGNLIVGYNEMRREHEDGVAPRNALLPNIRTGSHNVIIGKQHSYGSYGGLVAGRWNEVLGAYATVAGGKGNTASGDWSTVAGGRFNSANGLSAVVCGGMTNSASGMEATITGGAGNHVSGDYATVSGGTGNLASGYGSALSGGRYRIISGDYNWGAGSLVEDE